MQTWSSPSVPKLRGAPRPLRLHDTATGEVRPTAPGDTARLYVCGITPYDATHLGHAATYLAFDLVQRIWLDNGHDVHYVQNVTDVDDPLLERAARDQDDWVVLAMRETALFREDMEALRVLAPREFVGAVESIPGIVDMIEKLLASGAAYRLDDDEYPDVYFPHDTTPHFGYESNYDRETMLRLFAERGGDPERPGKRDPLDALLWRMARPGEPSWETSIGAGRPGWHIECSHIALVNLDTPFDLQGGGSDLVFPHHEYSAAHAEALTGRHPFARHYAHAGMIGLDGEKMSKSRGNLVFVSKLRSTGVDPGAIRLALFAGHYREDRPWTDELFTEAGVRLALWRSAANLESGPSADDVVARVREHLGNDLDTPKALAALDAWAREAWDRGGPDAEAPGVFRTAVDALLGIAL
ncbi:cysteine--1-D-myo-inosityl 2-amino-2-deoxy-alpha-D-glucopyranoside ligase [Actinosynnema sp.]|uniref:cysteine--1-D-myo-inosityl 2-amino-2-deoxy-alpha-D-glucopyranoside ligase n=1 Tax=Actinosynnema sp. TaxID=1872144 RepID=UPI003F876ABB